MARRRKKYLSQKRQNKLLKQEEQTTLFVEKETSFSSLIGKKVKINRGGPGSKEGILLSAKQDYVALLAGKEVLYFTIKHIHSITQNIKEGSSNFTESEEEFECSNSETFSDMLSELKYQSIQINNGPESREGILLNFNEEMMVILHEEDGPIFYNMEHVKLIKASLTSDDDKEENNDSKNKFSRYSRLDYQKYFGIIQHWNTEYDVQLGTSCFFDLIQTFKHKWVSINRSGPEALEGVLIDDGGGFFTIVNNEEAIRIHSFHIKNISEGAKGSFKTGNDEKEKQEQSYSYEGELQFSSELSDADDCSCEESFTEDDSLDEIIWSRSHEVKTHDVFN